MIYWAKFEGKLFFDPECTGPLLQTLPLKACVKTKGGWSLFYSIQDNEMKRCQELTLDKMNQVDKKLSPISHVTVNDIKFPQFSLGQVHTNLTQSDMQNDA